MDSRSVRDCVHQTHIRLAALMEHEHASLSLAQRCSGVPAGTPLFSGLLDFLHTSLPSETGSEVFETGSVNQEEEVHFPGIEFIAGRKRTNYPIALNVDDFGAAIYLTIQVINPIDPARVSEYMKQSLKSLVEALENNPDMAAIRLEVLPPEEHDLLLHTWNSDTMEYPKHQTIHGLFEETVMRMPEAIAIVHDDHELTYEDLNACANRLAHQLIELGVQLDTLVAICVDRSPAMLIGVLAVLKAGGVYVPMDPSYASKRLNNIIADAKPAILIADTVGRTILRDLDLPSITVVDPNASLALPSVNPKIVDLTSRHLAYIISTSGSAYKPKGVMIEHEGVVNLVVTRPAVCDIGSSSRVLLFPSFSFDSSVVEIFSTLCLGGALYLITDRIRLDRHQLWDYLKIHSITHALLPPAILQDCHDLSPLGSPLTLIIAGDALPPSLLRTLQGLIPNGRIINDYGPTEATVSSITWMCPQDFNDDVVPIGRPIRNKRVYILNRHHQPVPPGAVGDLYIGGVGVGRGYRNKPKLTEEVFLSDPFVRDRDPEARMYKTGDLARYLPDGNIVYMGRDDHQVKIRGFRIELGEIESRLTEHPLVQMTAVIALGEGIDKRLIAYVAAIPDDQLVPSLRSHLASCLPDYMVPAAFMRLDTLPLNSSGKIDRKALPEPDNDAIGHQDFEARGEIESALRDIWVELLNVDGIGRHDSFFILGGHSLLAVKLISQIRSLMGFNITLRMLFEAPTIAELSARLLDTSNSQEDAFDVLLPIRPQGSRSPLFCIHPGMGLSWCFIGLSRHLNADQPLYGLQERGFFDNGQPAATIDEMASDYICQIRRIQAHGPYHLLGYSFGGMVAHTMAVQLEQQGEKVSLLALMDSIPSLKDTREFNVAQDILPHVGGGDVDEILTKTFWKKASDVCQWNDRLGRLHMPLIYNGEMLLFRAMEQESEDHPLDPEDWKPYVQGKIHVYDINCKHDDMYGPEPLTEIGSVLAQKLGENILVYRTQMAVHEYKLKHVNKPQLR
ncbi:hypothetical protein BGZ65_005628 [Modicella reniformis]|uniref:Carrier domain-containing protein n=1 Tax=Modicella reniformis TaxID=1440133 RepID=A0A9P6IXI6_9FUNG|nr:hypothetical protein BGZ65_005628 [Modicella reniformis]